MKTILTLLTLQTLLPLYSFAQWVEVSNGMEDVFVYSLAASGNYIFAGANSDYGVYVSTNNGTSWTQTSLNNQNVYSLAVDGNYIFAGTGSGVFLSTDNGSTWNPTPLNQVVYSLLISGNYIFAGANFGYGVYVSTNNGINWTQTSLNNEMVLSLAVNGNYIFAGVYDHGVYYSTNNGTNWTQTPLNNQRVQSLAVNGNRIFAGTYAAVYWSTDNGASWQISLNNNNIPSLAINGNNIFAGTYGNGNGVYISTNNGTSWTQRNEGLSNIYCVFALLVLNNYIFAGTNIRVYRRPIGELTGIQSVSNDIPEAFRLHQNYPNPFNPSTKIRFDIPSSNGYRGMPTKLTIFDILGREIAVVVNENLNPGTYEVTWDAGNYPSGIYFYRLRSGTYSETGKMVLTK